MRIARYFLPVLLLTCCAGLTVVPVDPTNDATANGIRYYRSSKYLLVRCAQQLSEPMAEEERALWMREEKWYRLVSQPPQ